MNPESDQPVARGFTRRRFVEGLTLTGAVGLLPRGALSTQGATISGAGPELTGDRFDLTVASLAVNFTGNERHATAVNGSVPAPTLRVREGDTLTINVTNRLSEPTSIHWHGLLLPNAMDGVPGLTFRGIAPRETFTYRFPVRQSGTYWYHSHSGMQEQTGLYGPLIIEPRAPEPYTYERDYVVMLSDWTDQDPMSVVANLKQQSDYYNYQRRTLSTFAHNAGEHGLKATFAERLMWGGMRMNPSDILDVSGAAYTYLLNGQTPASNWTGLFKPGERVRLRFINASSMTIFDVHVPGLPLNVVQADGQDLEPVSVEEFRIGPAETYDVIVTPPDGSAYSIFAQAQDRSGFARGTLAPRAGMLAAVPPMDPRPLRTMTDMGIMNGRDMPGMDMSNMSAEDVSKMPGMGAVEHGPKTEPTQSTVPSINADGVDPASLAGQPNVDQVPAATKSRLAEAGTGLDDNGRRVLTYADLKSLTSTATSGPPGREIEFHLTGSMERWVWGFDGRKFSEAGPVRIALRERVRFVLINDTMMEHPIHLHGFFTALENGQGDRLPLKHTILVKPAERLSFLWTADVPGHWAFHCHLLYHMDTGMFRTVLIG